MAIREYSVTELINSVFMAIYLSVMAEKSKTMINI